MDNYKVRYSIIKFLFNFPVDTIRKIERIIGAQMKCSLIDLLNTFNIENNFLKYV